MDVTLSFFINSALLGIGLAMDAFSVSLANGLNDPQMKRRSACLVAGIFAFFQALMPMLGWVCVHTVIQIFGVLEKCIPWIALLLLAFIGGKMLWEGIHDMREKQEDAKPGAKKMTFSLLLLQGIATSIDALSVGFTIASYNIGEALLASFIIAAVTFLICISGVFIGKKFGTRLSGKATVFGGLILIGIGLEIFISSFF